jgi:hypothetical protein
MNYADAHFRPGSSHMAEGTPCQDYAMPGKPGSPVLHAVLSDGCSTAGRTDIGARLITLAAACVLERSPGVITGDFIGAAMQGVLRVAAPLGLDDIDLDATLGAVAGLPDGGAAAALFGDGVIAAKTSTGTSVWIMDWAGNMPGYPGYSAGNPGRLARFIAESTAAADREKRPSLLVSEYRISPNGELSEIAVDGRDASDGLAGLTLTWEQDNLPDILAVMSDGVLQVTGLPWHVAVRDITSIGPARLGSFATRRMSKALQSWSRGGHTPYDDISVAALAAAGGSNV